MATKMPFWVRHGEVLWAHLFREGKEIDPERKETNQVMGGFEGLREVELFRGSGFDPSFMNLCEG